MIYRWFWRCSSDPNTHSSFTGTSWVSEERKTFSRPADGRKMKRDHPNCWTAQLKTIVKTFSCVCVCEQYRWSGLTLIINPQLSHPESRWCGTIQPVSGFICSTSFSPRSADDVIHQKPSLQEDRVLFSGEEKRDAGFSLQQSAKNRTLSSLVRSFPFNCSVFIQCINKEAWGRSGILEKVLKYDKDWQILMEVNSGLVVSDR